MSLMRSLRRTFCKPGIAAPQAVGADSPKMESAASLSRDHVLWAYRLLLDREAGPQDDVEGKLEVVRSTRDLRATFLSSPEYAHKNPTGAGFIPTTGTAIAVLPGELRLFLDLADRMIGINVLQGNYELEEVAFARTCIAPGDHVLDIGANIGYFTILMADWVGTTGSVVAFEPVPANLQLLGRSIAENGFEERIRVVPSLVSDAAGEADMLSADVRYAFNSGGSYIAGKAEPTPLDHRRLRVAKTRLDGFEMPRPVSFIKLDVEGAEGLALRGARDLLRTDRPRVLAEINPDQLLKVSGTSATDLMAEMEALGFECRVIENGDLGPPIHSAEKLVNVLFLPRG